ncbi:MAG: hypothetical protein VR72_18805 [Clostridiaceae bacterium BRH_c20a]|nr:MAG: hypothetical protein VR72_18805 [Clostridiaceae bacterium BRH_c20a]
MFKVRIGVFSDTHNNLTLAKEVLNKLRPLDLLLHAGDHYRDGRILEKQFEVNTKVVVGNCDFFSGGPEEEIIELGENTLLLTHGHKYGVKNTLQRLYYRSQEVGANIVVFGHTHVPLYVIENNVHFLNPGSLTLPRGNSSPSYGIITLGTKMEIRLEGIVK